MQKLRVVIASPSDVREEREAAARIVRGAAESEPTIECVETFLWEKNVPPGFSQQPIQIGLIDPLARIADSDILIVLFSRKLGSPIAPGRPTGTEYEFRAAYESWQTTGRPHIMVYFNDTPFAPATMEEVEQFAALMRFRFSFPAQGLYGTFRSQSELEARLAEHIRIVFREVKARVKKPFSVDDFNARVQDVDPHDYGRL